MDRINPWKKINPLWWLGNCDEPLPPDDKFIGQPQWLRRLRWFLRNPFHNFTYYVIGVADRKFDRINLWNKWGNLNLVLPLIAYRGKKWEWYFGWREKGNFGIAFRKSPLRYMILD